MLSANRRRLAAQKSWTEFQIFNNFLTIKTTTNNNIPKFYIDIIHFFERRNPENLLNA